METKFKIGDVIISNIRLEDPYWYWKVINIIFEKQLVKELGEYQFENCYILYSDLRGYSYLEFKYDDKFSIVDSFKSIINSFCPKCNGELVNKYSEWAEKEIKKCKNCGWC